MAPDLEALLPQAVGGSTLTRQSVTGTSALGTDATSQALLASLSQYSKTSGDLQIAEAHDPTGTAQVQLFAFRVSGLSGSQLAAAIVASWMANTTQTPTQSQATVAGHSVTKVSYAQGATDYVYATDTVAFDIETADASVAAAVLPLLK